MTSGRPYRGRTTILAGWDSRYRGGEVYESSFLSYVSFAREGGREKEIRFLISIDGAAPCSVIRNFRGISSSFAPLYRSDLSLPPPPPPSPIPRRGNALKFLFMMHYVQWVLQAGAFLRAGARASELRATEPTAAFLTNNNGREGTGMGGGERKAV